MTSSRPYLVRALYEWITDNDLTPYVLVNTEDLDVTVPEQFIKDGKIVLNISSSAVQQLDLGNEFILFNARFSGSPMQVSFPVQSVLAIYAMENGQGMVFTEEEGSEPSPPEPSKPSRPSLKVVK